MTSKKGEGAVTCGVPAGPCGLLLEKVAGLGHTQLKTNCVKFVLFFMIYSFSLLFLCLFGFFFSAYSFPVDELGNVHLYICCLSPSQGECPGIILHTPGPATFQADRRTHSLGGDKFLACAAGTR